MLCLFPAISTLGAEQKDRHFSGYVNVNSTSYFLKEEIVICLLLYRNGNLPSYPDSSYLNH